MHGTNSLLRRSHPDQEGTKGPLTGNVYLLARHMQFPAKVQNDQTSEACTKVLRDLNFVHRRAGKLHVTSQQIYIGKRKVKTLIAKVLSCMV